MIDENDAHLALPADVPVLSDEELEALPQDLRDQYLAAVEAEMEATKLTGPQMRAHELGLRVDEILYGGAAGGGKSHFAIWHADWCSRQWPMHRTLILRTKLPELRRTLMAKAHELIDTDAPPGANYRTGDKEWHYGNGSVIEFGYCESFEDTRQYLSAEYELIIIDESTDMTAEQIEMLRSRLRTTRVKKGLGVNPHLLLLTNPGGISHAWHRDRFVNPTNHGEYVVDVDEPDEKGRGRARKIAFVPAFLTDNPFIDPDYESGLLAISDPVRRAQYLDGDWSVFGGQFFAEFDRGMHVVEPFEIPESWPRFGGYDWGYAAPACLLLAAVDEDRRIHIYREMYEERHTAADQARIYKKWGERPDFIAADPSIWRNTGQGVPISAQLTAAGMRPLRKASNARVDGWNRVREYLALGEYQRDGEVVLMPGVVIHSNCENLIRTLPEAPRDKTNPEDLDTRSEDHALDAFRYLLMCRARYGRVARKEPQTYDERVHAYVAKKMQPASRRPVHEVLGRV